MHSEWEQLVVSKVNAVIACLGGSVQLGCFRAFNKGELVFAIGDVYIPRRSRFEPAELREKRMATQHVAMGMLRWVVSGRGTRAHRNVKRIQPGPWRYYHGVATAPHASPGIWKKGERIVEDHSRLYYGEARISF